MGQRLKKSSLFFGQTAKEQEPPKPTMSGFYRGVGEEQVGAVQDIAKKVKETTAELPKKFGFKYGTEGEAEFDDKTPFKPTVDIKTGIASTTAPKEGYTTFEQATQAAEQSEKNVERLEEEAKAARAKLGESTEESLKKAAETAKTAQETLTEKKLGERREASELERAAQDYRNVLQTTPGTSNVNAVATLMKYYDPKYRTLESSLRQGEIALARQQTGATETALQQAEGERGGAVTEYQQAATRSYEDAKKLIDKEKQDKLAKIKEFYDDLSKKEKESGTAAGTRAKEIKEAKDKAAAETKAIEDSETEKIGNTLFGSPDPVTGARKGGSFESAFNEIDSGSGWQNELNEYNKAEKNMFFIQHKGWTRDKQRIEAKIDLHREYRSAMLTLKGVLQDALDKKDYATVKTAQDKIDALVNTYKRKDAEIPRPSKIVRV